MIIKNSSNSICPDPSSSTSSIISRTSYRPSANPSPIRGSSNSSIPIEPPPSSSRATKHSLSFLNSSSEKSKTWDLPLWQNHFRDFFSFKFKICCLYSDCLSFLDLSYDAANSSSNLLSNCRICPKKSLLSRFYYSSFWDAVSPAL